MAGSQKEYELLFKLKATLGGDFKNTFKQAIDTQKQLQSSLKNVNSLQSKIDGYTKQSAAIEDNRKKLDGLNTTQQETVQKIQAHKEKIAELKVAIKETGDETGELKKQLQLEKDELSETRSQFKRNETQIQQTTAKIKDQEEQLGKLSEELKKAGVNTDNLTGENERLQKSYDKLKASQETLRKLDEKQQQITQSIGKTKSQLLGTVGVMSAVAAAVYAGPIKTYQDFEAEMSTVAGITHATGEELEALKNAAKLAGQTTWATATESAQALEYMSLAGWTSEQSIAALNDMLMAAKISGLDLGASTDLVTDSMSAMGLSVDQLGHYLDVTTKANNVANTTSSALMEAILGCAGAAKTNGISLESLSTALSVFANNGLKGTQAGTAMNAILVRMTSNDKALKEMARLGVAAFDEQTGSFRDMGDILKDLEAQMVSMTDAERDASLKAIAGTNYYSQFAYLLDSVSEAAEGTAGSWDVLTEKLNNADGAAGEMYDTMMNNLSGAMTEAKSAIEAVQLALGEALTPALTDVVRAATPYIQKVATFITDHKELVATVAKVVAALAAARVGFLGLKLAGLTGESGIISIIKKLVGLRAGMIANAATGVSFAKTLGGIVGKALPIIGIITTIITAFKMLKDHLQEVRNFIQRTFGDEALAVFDKIIAVITSVGDTIRNAFSDGNISAVRDKIQEIFGDKGAAVFDKLVDILRNVISVVQNVIDFIVTNVVPVAEQIFTIISTQIVPGIISLVQAAAPVIMEIVGSITDFISALIPVIADAIAALMPIIQDVLTILSNNVLPIISEVFGFIASTVLPVIAQGVKELLSVIQNALAVLIPAIQKAATAIWKVIQPIIAKMLEIKKTAISTVLSIAAPVIRAIGGVINGLATALNGIITFLTGVFAGDWTQAWDGIKGIFSGIWAGIVSIADGVGEAIKTALNPIIEWFGELWERIKAPFIAAADWFYQTVAQPIITVFSPIVEKVGEIIAKLWEIITALFSVAAQWFNTNVVQPIVTLLSAAIGAISSFFGGIWQEIQDVFNSVAGWFSSKFTAAWEGIKAVFAPVGEFFSGVWGVIKEQFTTIGTAVGDAVSNAFKAVVNAILTFAETKINGFINAINTCIGIVNNIPGVSISALTPLEIPKLAKGSTYTPDTFIAGERGPELITNAPGRTVFTASQTKDIMAAQNTAATAVRNAPIVQTAVTARNVNAAPMVAAAGMGNGSTRPSAGSQRDIIINNNPVIYVNGDQPDDLEEKLEENNQRLLQRVENMLDDKADKEERQKYD